MNFIHHQSFNHLNEPIESSQSNDSSQPKQCSESNKSSEPNESEEFKESDNFNVFKTPELIESHSSSDQNVLHLPDFLTTQSPPLGKYFIEVIKNGTVVEKRHVTNSRISFGRSRDCDFQLDHPSISRVHAVILWSNKTSFDEDKFFLIDLNSTHGTFLNKERIYKRQMTELLPGNNVIKFGGSSRYFMLNSNFNDYREALQNVIIHDKNQEPTEEKKDEGCDWGFKDDTDYESFPESGEGYSVIGKVLNLLSTGITNPTVNDHVYSGNVQKTVQQWFDREGYDFVYNTDYQHGQFKCSFDLPLEGQYIKIEGNICVKKKDALNDACLKICQLLDQVGLLFPWQKPKNISKIDESSESESEMIDETESYKIKKAKKLANKLNKKAGKEIQNFETLNARWKDLSNELQKLKIDLVSINLVKKKEDKQQETDCDSLDYFMKNVNSSNMSMNSGLDAKITKSKLKVRINALEEELRKLEKLIKITKQNFEFDKKIRTLDNSLMNNDASKNSKALPSFREMLSSKMSKKIEEKKKIDKNDKIETNVEKKNEVNLTPSCSNFEMKISKRLCKTSVASQFMEEGIEIKKNNLDDGKTFNTCKEKKFGLICKKQKKKENKNEAKMELNYLNEADYIEWVPPIDQVGDGKTSLNEKYGY